jgi:hypothetical protein
VTLTRVPGLTLTQETLIGLALTQKHTYHNYAELASNIKPSLAIHAYLDSNHEQLTLIEIN